MARLGLLRDQHDKKIGKRFKRLNARAFREALAEVVEFSERTKEPLVLTRHGQDRAALIAIDDLWNLELLDKIGVRQALTDFQDVDAALIQMQIALHTYLSRKGAKIVSVLWQHDPLSFEYLVTKLKNHLKTEGTILGIDERTEDEAAYMLAANAIAVQQEQQGHQLTIERIDELLGASSFDWDIVEGSVKRIENRIVPLNRSSSPVAPIADHLSVQSAPQIRGHIQFEHVTFHYPGSATPAVKDISFAVNPGQFLGIVGRSGSGKTTIIRLLQGLYTPQTGLIKIDGQDVKELDPAHLCTQIGVVSQENCLFRGTVRENVAMAKPTASLDEVVRAAQLADADEFIQRLPHGYSTMLEEGATNLSGGQRQRLAIARVLIHDPPVLVFDDVASSLDPESQATIQDHLAGIARGRTVIMITHRLSFLAHSDAIIVMDEGRIVHAGKHDQLGRMIVQEGNLVRLRA